MGKGVFPIQVHEDMEGNKWHKQEKKEAKVKQGVDGVHAILAFQYEDCWMINLEGRKLRLPQDELYFMLHVNKESEPRCYAGSVRRYDQRTRPHHRTHDHGLRYNR